MNPNYAFVAKRAGHICEYCHAPEAVFNLQFEVEHIKPLSRGGDDSKNNLALSCRSCNLYKSDAVSFFDEETRRTSRLFNPRRNLWKNNFKINHQTGEILGLTAIGRATAACLKMNGKIQSAARVQWLKLALFE
jgi:hypothetical protein